MQMPTDIRCYSQNYFVVQDIKFKFYGEKFLSH
jgi:hypothetical protein